MELNENDLVLCTVDRIIGTAVFVKIEGFKNIEGSIILSEVAPGRIRNLRDYVVPKKMIVCKILSISPNGNINLSLRRVSEKERKETLNEYKQEKSYLKILKSLLKEKAEKVIEEILKEDTIYNFLERSKEEQKILEKLTGKEEAKKIIEIINTQKSRKVVVKKNIKLFSNLPNGVMLLKEILGKIKKARINYVAAGRYTIKIESEDPKKADNELKAIIDSIEKISKKEGMEFSVAGK